jgi:hypothetical protein
VRSFFCKGYPSFFLSGQSCSALRPGDPVGTLRGWPEQRCAAALTAISAPSALLRRRARGRASRCAACLTRLRLRLRAVIEKSCIETT